MFKHLYETLKISILCGSLLTLQSSVVFAAGVNTTDANGVITNTQTHSFGKIQDSDMLASLGMLGGGFIAARMIGTYKPPSNDVMIAGAAGVAFIAGEVMSNLKFKGTIDAMSAEVDKKSDGTINEAQIQRLKDLKKSYEEAKSTTSTKKTLQMASAAGFGIAAAAAGLLAYTEYALVDQCITGIAAASAVCSNTAVYGAALSKYNIARQYPGPTHLKEAHDKAVEATLVAPFVCVPNPATEAALSVVGATSVAALKAIADANLALNTPCKVAVTTLMKNQVFTFDVARLTTQNNILDHYLKNKTFTENLKLEVQKIVPYKKSFFDHVLDLVMQKAEASWLPMLGLSAGVAATFLPVLAGMAAYVDLWMYVPLNRVYVFGSLGAIAALAAKSSDNQIKKIDENISKIDKILQDLEKMAVGIKTQNLTQQQISVKTINTPANSEIPFSKNSVKTDCLSGNGTDNCKSTTDQLQSMPGFANLPDSFKNIASQATKLGDNLSGTTGMSGSTLASANVLAGKQAAIAKLLANTKGAFQKLTNGKVNLNKEQDKFMDGLKNALTKSLQKQGMTASGMMASLGSSGINGAGSAKLDSETALKKEPVAAPGIDINAPSNGAEKEKALNLNFKDAPAENVAAGDMASGAMSNAQPEYEIDSNEINGKNGPSLFEVISGRYLKSGYPKLLEEVPVKK
jgi:hypothetical protein